MNIIKYFADSSISQKAAELFCHEMNIKYDCNSQPSSQTDADFCFIIDDSCKNDDFVIEKNNNQFIFKAGRLRGLIFACAQYLRKIELRNNQIVITKDIAASYHPYKRIRGHQIGYRTTPNSYDAWDYDMYQRYYIDLMMMGCNTVEHIPYERGVSKRNRLMKYDEEEFLIKASEMADALDLDVSLWFPNSEDDIETACKRREKVFSSLKRLNYVFPPGGDPGELEPDELLDRCTAFRKILKKYHPDAQLWPSAQQPHSMPFWGEDFLKALQTHPDAVDGIITGPNRAFDIDVLRKRLPSDYEIRLYPDITHNVRCEYPVHFDRDDWHYTFTSTLSRECINPRPVEYKKIHESTRGYVIGSVSYSEGINDDVNKFVWSSLDFDDTLSIRDILDDYARMFFVGSEPADITDAILALERNWEGDPAENPHIENTLKMWIAIGNNNPSLCDNWRYNALLFRACCDAFVRRKYIVESQIVIDALKSLRAGLADDAESILNCALPKECTTLRTTIQALGEKLFEQIGLQLDVEHYCADNPERGATFDTIDLPITDKQWLLKKIEYAKNLDKNEQSSFLHRVADRNIVDKDEKYFSFALHELSGLGAKQEPDFYMNFQGDRPNVNTGDLPVCMFKLYDHFSLYFKCSGFSANTDYVLQVTYKEPANTMTRHHKIVANDTVIYEGKQFGGYRNAEFEAEMLPDGYAAVCYDLDSSVFNNGCLELKITEPMIGFQISEFRIIKK
ncbi:MAG: hypothetical protein IJO14_09550 [Clostridia bacterium]|nr:hypothetical protein [Clostridia bacterium]